MIASGMSGRSSIARGQSRGMIGYRVGRAGSLDMPLHQLEVAPVGHEPRRRYVTHIDDPDSCAIARLGILRRLERQLQPCPRLASLCEVGRIAVGRIDEKAAAEDHGACLR